MDRKTAVPVMNSPVNLPLHGACSVTGKFRNRLRINPAPMAVPGLSALPAIHYIKASRMLLIYRPHKVLIIKQNPVSI